MSAVSLEQRVAALESQVQQLKRELHALSVQKPNSHWLDQVAGSMRDFPEWDEVMQICRDMREAELAEFDKVHGEPSRARP
jgi:hypothetical protein